MRAALKFLFSAFLVILLFLSFKSSVFAQTTAFSPNLAPDVPRNSHVWIQTVMLDVLSAFSCQLTNVDPSTPGQKCLGVNPKTGQIGYIQKGNGLADFSKNMIVSLYTPPVKTSDYVNYMASNFGIVKSSYAATPRGGGGLFSLTPLVSLWTVFRNVVYALFVVIFLTIGIAIMLRVKIDPRTVMSVQNQIPKIIIGIILVTFSLAIAGFLIDLMYAICYLFIGLVASADAGLPSNTSYLLVQSTNPFNALYTAIGNSGTWDTFVNIAWLPAQTIGTHMGALFQNLPGQTIMAIVTGIVGYFVGHAAGSLFDGIGTVVGGLFGTFIEPGGGTVAGAGIGSAIGSVLGKLLGGASAVAGFLDPQDVSGTFISIIAFLIIAISVIVSLFRLWFQLIIAYISILIDIIFAPFWIVGGLIPGSKINFTAWIRSLLANLSVFPVVLLLFLLARVFIDAFSDAKTGLTPTGYFVPPLIGNAATAHEIGTIIALGLVLVSPNAVKMMKQVFGAPAGGFGSVFEGLSTGFGMFTSPVRRIGGSLFGRDPYTKHAKIGTEIVGNFIGRRAARLGPNAQRVASNWTSLLTGAGFTYRDEHGNDVRRDFGVGRMVNRVRPVGRNPIQGPVPQGADERTFRRTGETTQRPPQRPAQNPGGNNPGHQGTPEPDDAAGAEPGDASGGHDDVGTT